MNSTAVEDSKTPGKPSYAWYWRPSGSSTWTQGPAVTLTPYATVTQTGLHYYKIVATYVVPGALPTKTVTEKEVQVAVAAPKADKIDPTAGQAIGANCPAGAPPSLSSRFGVSLAAPTWVPPWPPLCRNESSVRPSASIRAG